jgi:endonuclease III
MLSLTERAARVRRIDRLLERMHGRQVREHTGTGLDMLVEAMLAQNTNLSNALAGYKQLKRAFPTWNKVLAASVADVQRHIAICGLARMRARRLQALLRRLKDEHGKLSIDFLANMDVRSVARRLRLVRLIARDAEAGKVLAQLTPPKRIYSLHVLMFTHSKKLCRPKNPKCDECLLLDLCPHGQRRMKHRPPDPIVRVNGRPVIRSHYASAGIAKRATRNDAQERMAAID